MSSKSKIEEVQFYLDRSLDALITLIRSIVDNPRIPENERFQAMCMLAEHHGSITQSLAARISAGLEQCLAEQESARTE